METSGYLYEYGRSGSSTVASVAIDLLVALLHGAKPQRRPTPLVPVNLRAMAIDHKIERNEYFFVFRCELTLWIHFTSSFTGAFKLTNYWGGDEVPNPCMDLSNPQQQLCQ